VYAPLCEPWPLPEGCSLTGEAAATDQAVAAASRVLWELSGRRYGACEVLLRPCRPDCSTSAPGGWWDGLTWPVLSPGASLWWEARCGRCSTGCGCTTADSIQLPTAARDVTEVMIDGVVFTDWRLYDGRSLVRTDGGSWPRCQDWTVGHDQPGAWAVTAIYGEPVDEAAQFALWDLARDYVSVCSGGECRIPRRPSAVTRQGVSMTFPTVAEVRHALGAYPLVTAWLNAINPAGLRDEGAQIWDPQAILDETGWRRPGGI
jgi:hypothetical protein